MTPTYSLIVPHYNIPQLLERLLNSFPPRPDTELLIVDDCSDADAFTQLQQLKRPDLRLLQTPTNKGAGAARNLGLEAAKGEKIIFADADDFFLPGIGETLDRYADDTRDLLCFLPIVLDAETLQLKEDCDRYDALMQLHEEGNPAAEFAFRYRSGLCYSKIYRRDYLLTHHIRFHETPVYNDIAFSCMAGHYAQSIGLEKRAFYCYVMRNNSLTSLNGKHGLCILQERAWRNHFIFTHTGEEAPLMEDDALRQLYKLKRNDRKSYALGRLLLEKYGYSPQKIKKFLRRKWLCVFRD